MKKPLPTEFEKKEVEKKFRPLIEEWKKTRLGPPHPEYAYKIDIYSKWYRNSFYLCSLYKSDSPGELPILPKIKLPGWNIKGVIALMLHI
jgi:hypothetical protein